MGEVSEHHNVHVQIVGPGRGQLMKGTKGEVSNVRWSLVMMTQFARAV